MCRRLRKEMGKLYIADNSSSYLRLDKFLALKAGCSRGQVKNMILAGKIMVNGAFAEVSYRLKAGDKVFVPQLAQERKLLAYNLGIPIIYEDDSIIVVNKPEGLAVHPSSFSSQKTLVNALLGMGKRLAYADNPLRPGIVHRLDKDTSGVMVVAKNKEAYEDLISQFKERKVKKEYFAAVEGNFKHNYLQVSLPLVRNKSKRLQMKVSGPNAKEALTEFEVVQKLREITLLKVSPHTGRMHQIRVHLKFLGYPVIGDKKYGRRKAKRMYLHAHRISFFYPASKKKVSFNAPLPDSFQEFIKENYG